MQKNSNEIGEFCTPRLVRFFHLICEAMSKIWKLDTYLLHHMCQTYNIINIKWHFFIRKRHICLLSDLYNRKQTETDIFSLCSNLLYYNGGLINRVLMTHCLLDMVNMLLGNVCVAVYVFRAVTVKFDGSRRHPTAGNLFSSAMFTWCLGGHADLRTAFSLPMLGCQLSPWYHFPTKRNRFDFQKFSFPLKLCSIFRTRCGKCVLFIAHVIIAI